MRPITVIVLALALAIGIFARLYNLTALEMSADEGETWAAAAEPSVIKVFHAAEEFNPGKMSVHDVLLHLWMRVFGDSLFSIRALSAAFGTISILLVFLIVREAFAGDASGADSIGAAAALLVAVNLRMIMHARMGRMYAVMLAMVLAQVCFVLRAERRGGLANYLGIAVFSALAVASHFFAAMVIVAESLWLAPGPVRRWRFPDAARDDRGWKIIATFGVTALAMLPLALHAISIGVGFARTGALGWIELPPLRAPFTLFHDGVGSDSALIMCVILAASGAVFMIRDAPQAASFLFLWMFVPSASLVLISYTLLPVFIYQYALSSLVPFLILVAAGIYHLRSVWAWSLALVAVTAACALPMKPMLRGDRPPRMIEWSEAAEVAAANLKPGEYAIVCSSWMGNVVKYYLRNNPQAQIAPARMGPLKREKSSPTILLISDGAVQEDARIANFFLWTAPEVIAKFRGVSVRRVLADRFATIRQ
jgi:mannosyltransferase